MVRKFIPASGAVIDGDEVRNLVDVANGRWFTEGRYCKSFAIKLKNFFGVRHVSLCNSGSSANLLAIAAIAEKYRNGHMVVTSATCFPTTIAPLVQYGYVPLFIDNDPSTLNPDIDTIITVLRQEEVAGIIQAHTLGFPFDAEAVREECDRLGKFFIEDCADAFGSKINGQKLGTLGHISTLSFFPAHFITTGEGGAVLTNDGKLLKIINSYRDWGRDCWCLPGQDNTCGKRFDWKWPDLPKGWDHKYTFTRLGYNLKMTDMQAAIGSAQMNKIDNLLHRRANNYDALYESLSQFSDHIQIIKRDDAVYPFGFPIIVKSSKFTKQEFVTYLEAKGIATREIFAGNITRQPVASTFYHEIFSNTKGSDYLMENAFWVGCWPGIFPDDLSYMLDVIHKFIKQKGT